MSRLILGIPMKWLLALLATLVGGAAVVGTGAVVVVLAVVQSDDVLPPVSEPPVFEVVWEDPVDLPIAFTVPITSPVVPTDTVPATSPPVPTDTVPLTLPVVLTVTVPLTESVVPTDTESITPTVELIEPGMSGLAFHPAHLNAGGKCRLVYQARGSLKNHGPDPATGVVIEIDKDRIKGGEWLDKTKGDGGVEITVTPSDLSVLDTSKPARFTVSVYTNDDWPLAGKGEKIEVWLVVAGDEGTSGEEGTEVVFVVRNQCKPDKPVKPEKPAKPEKLENPVKPDKPAKPEKPARPEKPEKPKKDK